MRDWRKLHRDIEIVLIRGNHDSHAGDPPKSWGIRCHTGALVEPPFEFRHEPPHGERAVTHAKGYIVAGHIHPAVMLTDRGGSQLRMPCFSFGPTYALLPAFGSFTGTWPLAPAAQDRIFVIGHDEVLEV